MILGSLREPRLKVRPRGGQRCSQQSRLGRAELSIDESTFEPMCACMGRHIAMHRCHDTWRRARGTLPPAHEAERLGPATPRSGPTGQRLAIL